MPVIGFIDAASAADRTNVIAAFPAGIICDAGGNVIVVDSGNDRLQVFTPTARP